MAKKAPRPGIGKRIMEAEAASQVVTFVMDDDKIYRYAPGTVSTKDRLAVMDGIGRSYEWVFGGRVVDGEMVQTENIDPILSTFVLWWLARRHSGEPDLTFEQADDEFVTAVHRIKSVAMGEPNGTDPEA